MVKNFSEELFNAGSCLFVAEIYQNSVENECVSLKRKKSPIKMINILVAVSLFELSKLKFNEERTIMCDGETTSKYDNIVSTHFIRPSYHS